MELECFSPPHGRRLAQIRAFLQTLDIGWDEGAETTICVTEAGEMLATGSRQGNVIKCVGVSSDRQGEGLAATVVTELVKDAVCSGFGHLFLFTRPNTALTFTKLGFYPVVSTSSVALLENRRDGAQDFVSSLSQPFAKAGAMVSAIVANCNPFTNGHLYLIETAAAHCDLLHLFILSEERSCFSSAARMEMARQATASIKNVQVHPTSDYLISSATFPRYFLKDEACAEEINAELDLVLFARCFAKPMGITHRWVGSEPDCPVTAAYNRQMHEVLPQYGIRVVELARCKQSDRAVSAGRVRELLSMGDWEKIRPLVPVSTYRYLERMKNCGEAFRGLHTGDLG